MAATWSDAVGDASLNEIKNNATKMSLCSSVPTNYEQATSPLGTGDGRMLAIVDVTGTDFTVQAAQSGTGREMVTAKKSGTVSVTGTAVAVGYTDGVSVWLASQEMVSQAVTQGNPVDFPADGTLILYNRDPATI